MANFAGGNIAENVAILATIDPDAYGTGTQTTDIIDMRYWREVMFIVTAGDLGASATLDFSVAASAASNMGSSSSISGKSITQFTQAGTDSDKQAIVRVTAEEVAAIGIGHRYIQGTLTIGTAASDAAVIVLGVSARYQPVDAIDLASVDEIVH